jgi:hypothetical protein
MNQNPALLDWLKRHMKQFKPGVPSAALELRGRCGISRAPVRCVSSLPQTGHAALQEIMITPTITL